MELERVVPLNGRVMPYLWVTGVDTDEGLRRLRADPDVVESRALAEGRDGLLAGIDWHDSHPLLDALSGAGATCLRGVGGPEGWQFSLRFPTRDCLATCYRECSEDGVDLTVDRIHATSWSAEGGHDTVLTDVQRETLTTALERGYFSVPRSTTLQDLATEFDVSDTAISQRIRRGVARLLAAELSEG
ncbi:helix-turn-helix domain-containing protein [Halolamina litorea]|uniref:Helix-turn-helix domain-containing protein n=1 Tax=Halolamina litorea TaxID=1515593 RepID=A0ABD6BTX9_9EURY|nr:helix-turn-helix domain-containing protein [Halolamina litorea]